jgi:hypothetical protein
MLIQLFTKPIAVFKRIESDESIFSSGSVFLFIIVYSCFTFLNGNDSYSSLLYGIPLVILEFVFLYFISPFIFSKISGLVGGVANSNSMRIVFAASLIPTIPGYAFMMLNDFWYDSFLGSVTFLEGVGSLFQFKILILGLAYYNKFSVKHAMMVLIILFASITILGIPIK